MIDEMRIPLGRRGLAAAVLLGLALIGCTRPEGLDRRQDVISSRLDVAPFYSEAYEGRLACPACGGGRADSELVLYRERRTGTPAGYQLNQRYQRDPADRRPVVEASHHGRWSIMQNGASPRDQPVYRFEPDDPTQHAFLLEQVDRDTLMARDEVGRPEAAGLRRSAAPVRGDLSVTEADSGLPVAIQVGQTLQILNSDPTLHNIHATPASNEEFNMGQPIQGMQFERTFDNVEVMVPFQCDVHGWMNAYIGVLDHPYFAVTATDGMFDISTLPPGNYVIEAWHEELGTQTQNVTVATGETADVSFTFAIG